MSISYNLIVPFWIPNAEELNNAYPRMYYIGAIVPDDKDKLFDSDFVLAALVMDAVEGKETFLNHVLIDKAFPYLWEASEATAAKALKRSAKSIFVTISPNDSGNVDISRISDAW